MQGEAGTEQGPCCTGEEQQQGVLPYALQKGPGGDRAGVGAASADRVPPQGPALQLSTLGARNVGIHQEVPRGERPWERWGPSRSKGFKEKKSSTHDKEVKGGQRQWLQGDRL